MHNSPSGKHKTGIIKRIIDKIRYNLVIQVIRNRLAAIGFEFTPYFLFKESINSPNAPDVPGNSEDYKVEFLNATDMKIIGSDIRGYTEEGFLENLKIGRKCLGLKYKGEILAFIWLDFNECNFKPHKFKMKSNEVYTFSLYTMESYRGRNLAPYLKYRSYKILKEMGIDNCYSISEYFNVSSLKYRKKLNHTKIKLALYISLFKKFEWSITLKTY